MVRPFGAYLLGFVLPLASAAKRPVGPNDFGLQLPSIPHARAAGAPTGRSLFWFTVFSGKFSVNAEGREKKGVFGSGRRLGISLELTQNCCSKRKRGPVQAPFFIIDAPKPVTESRVGSGHPGKPIFVSCVSRCKSVARCLMFMENLWTPLKEKHLAKPSDG